MHFTATITLTELLLAGLGSTHPAQQEQHPVSSKEYSLSSTIRDVLRDNKVIGDVLDDFEPTYYLDIAYPKSHNSVLLGNDIPVDAVSKRPVFTFHSLASPSIVDKNSVFTLALTDPDAKSRESPIWSEMCHWIITNLTTPLDSSNRIALSMTQMLKAKPGEIEEYLPPGPPPKTGAHRYVFVLLEGDTTDLKAPEDRKHWGYGKPRHGVRDWAEENGLKVVGANFFFAQNAKQ